MNSGIVQRLTSSSNSQKPGGLLECLGAQFVDVGQLVAIEKLPVLVSMGDDIFYLRIAWACAFVAVGGFTFTYLGPLVTGAFEGPAVLHLHGVLSFAWMMLFVAQAYLISSQRRQWHRTAGIFGVALASGMVFTVVSAGLDGLHNGIDAGFAHESREFLYVTMSQISLFSLMVIGAVAYRRRLDYHKRFMVLATIALLPPATARVLFFFFAAPEMGSRPGLWLVRPPANSVDFTVIAAMLANLLMIPAFVHDWRTRGKPHVVYVVAGGLMILVNLLRGPVSRTEL